MGQKPPKNRKQVVSGKSYPPLKLPSSEEIAFAAKHLDEMSRRGYGDVTELSIPNGLRRQLAERAMSNALGK